VSLSSGIDLAEVAALNGSGPLLSCVPPAVLDLDKFGTGCNLTVDVSRELDLIAGSREALCGIWATGKYFLLARHCRPSRLRVGHEGAGVYITMPDHWVDSEFADHLGFRDDIDVFSVRNALLRSPDVHLGLRVCVHI
jgi:hypothetical protein